MKLIRVLLGLFIIAGLVFVPMGTAKAYTLSVTTCLNIQNLEAPDALIDMTFYPQGGGTPTVISDTIPGNGFKSLCNLALAAGFNGSAVVGSNTKLAIVVNIQNPTFNGMMGSYYGFSDGSNTVAMPLLMKGNYGFNTQYTIQNIGIATASISVVYSDGQTAGPISVDPGQSSTFQQDAEGHAAGWIGSATITATGSQIAGVVLEADTSTLLAYNGFNPATGGSTAPVFPMVTANNSGYNTGINIQNTGGTDTVVTVTYTPTPVGATTYGTTCTETHTILAGKDSLFANYTWLNSASRTGTDCVIGQMFVGFGKVTSNSNNQVLVGVANQSKLSVHKGGAYSGFNSANATATILAPVVHDRNYGFFSSINVMNVGTGDVTVHCTYTGTSVVQDFSVAVNQGVTVQHFKTFTPGYYGSGTCVASGTNPKIVGVVNQINISGATDTFLVYEAINQ